MQIVDVEIAVNVVITANVLAKQGNSLSSSPSSPFSSFFSVDLESEGGEDDDDQLLHDSSSSFASFCPLLLVCLFVTLNLLSLALCFSSFLLHLLPSSVLYLVLHLFDHLERLICTRSDRVCE